MDEKTLAQYFFNRRVKPGQKYKMGVKLEFTYLVKDLTEDQKLKLFAYLYSLFKSEKKSGSYAGWMEVFFPKYYKKHHSKTF